PSIWAKLGSTFLGFSMALALVSALTKEAVALPNGTWLSKPQIWFHLSNQTLDQVMYKIRAQRYKFVFLDFRNVTDQDQQLVTDKVREYRLAPVVWIQSPQYRALSIEQMADAGRYADGIQVDDHFFSHYSLQDFRKLRSQYSKSIFCSIQPFQSALVPVSGCNQVDVQCYAPQTLQRCVRLADRLKAVTSLSSTNTLSYQNRIGGRSFNVFLWPHSDEFVTRPTPLPTVPNLEMSRLLSTH
ncbi:MAG: hypothetical protein WCD18_23255, partial [Thermosynechococcaceae cyanobacterium]